MLQIMSFLTINHKIKINSNAIMRMLEPVKVVNSEILVLYARYRGEGIEHYIL